MLIGGFILPGIGAIIGLVILFIAVKYIADVAKDESIFNNYLMHFICSIIAVVTVVIIFFVSIGGFSLSFCRFAETATAKSIDTLAIQRNNHKNEIRHPQTISDRRVKGRHGLHGQTE